MLVRNLITQDFAISDGIVSSSKQKDNFVVLITQNTARNCKKFQYAEEFDMQKSPSLTPRVKSI